MTKLVDVLFFLFFVFHKFIVSRFTFLFQKKMVSVKSGSAGGFFYIAYGIPEDGKRQNVNTLYNGRHQHKYAADDLREEYNTPSDTDAELDATDLKAVQYTKEQKLLLLKMKWKNKQPLAKLFTQKCPRDHRGRRPQQMGCFSSLAKERTQSRNHRDAEPTKLLDESVTFGVVMSSAIAQFPQDYVIEVYVPSISNHKMA